MTVTKAVETSLSHEDVRQEAFAKASHFRSEFYGCLARRGDELFELCDALLCTEGPVRTLVDLALAPEHRRGHGALWAVPHYVDTCELYNQVQAT
ncbi:hypothetical protein GCM10009612_59650 [Streptomyces beijiangensis]